MEDVDGLAVHQGATAHDRFDAEAAALLDRFVRDAPGSEGTMKPDLPDAGGSRVSHDPDGRGRGDGHHDSVHLTGDGRETRVAGFSSYGLGLRVDGNGVESALPELLEYGVRGLALLPGDAGDGKALPSKERDDGLRCGGHMRDIIPQPRGAAKNEKRGGARLARPSRNPFCARYWLMTGTKVVIGRVR